MGRGEIRSTRFTPAVIGRSAGTFGRYIAAFAGGAGWLVATPDAASAHGAEGSGETVGGFVWLGFTHMVYGWDHLLFVAGVVLLAGQVKRSAVLVTGFAAGHAATLAVATLVGWRFDTALVDIVAALSLAFLGVVGWSGRPARWRWFAIAVCGFGLVDGLGMSTRLQELGVHHEGALLRVGAVSLGVEIGQLVAVLGIFMLGDVLWHHLRPQVSRSTAWRVICGALMVIGLLAGAVRAATVTPAVPAATAPAVPAATAPGGPAPALWRIG